MEKFEEIKTITTKNLNTGETNTKETKRNYIVKTWYELTDEEKEKEIAKIQEYFYRNAKKYGLVKEFKENAIC